MKKTPLYLVEVEGHAVASGWQGRFTIEPTLTQIQSALLIDIKALENTDAKDDEDDERLDDLAATYHVLLRVITHAFLHNSEPGDVVDGHCWIGSIKITEEEVFSA